MPTVVDPEHLDNLRDECRLFCLEDVSDLPMDVESFWSRVLTLKSDEGEKFKCLSRLVLACLSLPHGNSDSERGFSDLCDIFTKKRNRLHARRCDGGSPPSEISDAIVFATIFLSQMKCVSLAELLTSDT